MTLSKEEVAELKNQLKDQVANLPHEQKAAALRQIDEMSDEAVELMLTQQKEKINSQPVFRSIIDGSIPSKKIAENEAAIAVLDIKPISKGHTVIIPKTQVTDTKDLPKQAFELAERVAQKITTEFKTEKTEILPQQSFGEIIINVIPVYDKPVNLNSPRAAPDDKELSKLADTLYIAKEKPKPKVIKQEVRQEQKIHILKRKIP